jgi:hypothetical protein
MTGNVPLPVKVQIQVVSCKYPLSLLNCIRKVAKNREMRYKVNSDAVAMRLAAYNLYRMSQQVPIFSAEIQSIMYIE